MNIFILRIIEPIPPIINKILKYPSPSSLDENYRIVKEQSFSSMEELIEEIIYQEINKSSLDFFTYKICNQDKDWIDQNEVDQFVRSIKDEIKF